MIGRRRALGAAGASLLLAPAAHAQYPQWPDWLGS